MENYNQYAKLIEVGAKLNKNILYDSSCMVSAEDWIKQVEKYNFAVKVTKLEKVEDFQSLVAENKKPVIVDFYADWCGPCKVLEPKLLAKAEKSDGWDIVKINIDNFNELAGMMNVQAVPTVFLIHNGKSVDTLVGMDDTKLNNLVTQAEKLGKE